MNRTSAALPRSDDTAQRIHAQRQAKALRLCPAGARRAAGDVSGFTLLELIIVIAIIGILASIAMPAMKNLPIRANEAALRANLRTFREVIDQHYGAKGYYPTSLESLVEEGFLRVIPVDPFTDSAETWEVVYEDFDPELEPAETDLPPDGQAGIIDVHSGSELMALDGTPYNEW